MSYPIKRICAIHDLSGFGRASLTLVIPILTTMGIQVCPLPTAILSSQTSGISGFTFLDLTSEMRAFLAHWKSLSLSFDAVYTGFLGSPEQIDIAFETISSFLLPGGFAFVDPVLGDNGILDPTQTAEMVDAQRSLIRLADCIAPNLTEAAFLLDTPYRFDISEAGLKDQLLALSSLGPKQVIITSAPGSSSELLAVYAYDANDKRFFRVENRRYPVFYPGTGDTFSSVIVGALLQGDSLPLAMTRAVDFVTLGIQETIGHRIAHTDGVLLEKVLPSLRNSHLTHIYTEL